MAIIFSEDYFKNILNIKLDKPTGQLSGHNSGEPFSDKVYSFLKEKNKAKIFKQNEYLNSVLKKNRKKIFETSFEKLMIYKKESSIKNWSINNLIKEKQDDTADILFIDKDLNCILDVKTRNLEKKGQAPNIISCEKLSILCKNLINNLDYENLEINYIGIDWILESNKMVCKNIFVIDLFKIDPKKIYINWAAALQIQFHVEKVDQSYSKDKKQWSIDFIKKYVSSFEERQKKQLIKIKPFKDLIKS